jgi:hypothetical protein
VKMTLGVGMFPVSAIVWVSIERFPSTRVTSKLYEMRLRESVYPLTNIIRNGASALKDPLTGKDRLGGIDVHHRTFVIVVPEGTARFAGDARYAPLAA